MAKPEPPSPDGLSPPDEPATSQITEFADPPGPYAPRRSYLDVYGGFIYRGFGNDLPSHAGGTVGLSALWALEAHSRAVMSIGIATDWAGADGREMYEDGVVVDTAVNWITARWVVLLGGGSDKVYGYGRAEVGPQLIFASVSALDSNGIEARQSDSSVGWGLDVRIGGGLRATVWRSLTIGMDATFIIAAAQLTFGVAATPSIGWRF